MTAYPNPLEFASSTPRSGAINMVLHPNVEEQFWGYELRMNETTLSLATLWRAVAGFGAAVALVTAMGLLIVSADNGLFTLVVAGFFFAIAGLCGNAARRGTQVRIQIDTSKGEVREVVDTKMGGVEVLTSYGMDAVRAVRLVGSRKENGFAQIHAEIEGYGPIPLADGAIAPLRLLRDRIAADCGLDTEHKREAEWAGPLSV